MGLTSPATVSLEQWEKQDPRLLHYTVRIYIYRERVRGGEEEERKRASEGGERKKRERERMRGGEEKERKRASEGGRGKREKERE